MGRFVLALAIAASLLTACSNAYDAERSSVVPQRQALQQIAPTWCQRFAACQPDDFARQLGTQEECVRTITNGASEKDDGMLQDDVDACRRKIERTACAALPEKLSCESDAQK